MMKNINDLKERKKILQAEISEMESVLSFKNPRKSVGIMTHGFTEKYLDKIKNLQMGNKVLPVIGDLLGTSMKLGSAAVFKKVAKKSIHSPLVKKVLVGAGGLVLAVLLAKKAKDKLKEYQQKETAKSLSKLI